MNAGPRLLETLGVPVLEGRGIEPDDVTASRRVAVINHHLADTLWPGENPLGRTVVVFGAPQQVVGVTVDAAMTRPQSGQSNFLFLPERQIGSNSGVRILYVRYATDETAAARAVRSAVREVDARVPVSSVRTMQQEIATENAPQILIATLLALFSVGSLIVAAIGLYAVVAFHTARRTREFGIRLALGAGSGDILAGVLRDGLLVTAIGAVVGVGLSLVVGRAFASLLVNVAPTDLPTYIGVIALVTAVSLTACAAPARRASRVDPVIALRQE
jgi:ABC-type antimicrobial peptide transport system permease subunit